MTVSDLIALLETMPPDAIVIHTLYSDYADIEPDDVTLMTPQDGSGLIRHHGHLMHLRKEWWPINLGVEPEFIPVAVHVGGY